MAAGDVSDIFMFFVHDGGQLKGESTTELQVKGKPLSDMLRGFGPGKMFEISKFEFNVGVKQEALEQFEYPGLKAALAKMPGFKLPKTPVRKAKGALDEEGSPVEVQPVSFTRPMDWASHRLLHHIIKRTYFTRVALVKRKSAGGAAAGEAYLRMDFNGVLLIDASWSNDDPIEETYKFHARSVTMRYKPQLPNGSLGAAKTGFWSMVPDEREATL